MERGRRMGVRGRERGAAAGPTTCPWYTLVHPGTSWYTQRAPKCVAQCAASPLDWDACVLHELAGLITCYAVWTRPSVWGAFGACMSSSFWWNNQDFNNTILERHSTGYVLSAVRLVELALLSLLFASLCCTVLCCVSWCVLCALSLSVLHRTLLCKHWAVARMQSVLWLRLLVG